MLALAGFPLGLSFRFLDSNPDSPARPLGHCTIADFSDPHAIQDFLRGVDLATYEFENVPIGTVDQIAARVPVYPPPGALLTGQDRLLEKILFRELGLTVHAFAPVNSAHELASALETIGLPAIAKTRRMGYDGKGQKVIRSQADADTAWNELGGRSLLVEQLISFQAEISALAVRARNGQTHVYPLIENVHRAGILHRSISPAPSATPALQAQAEVHIRAVMDRLNYVGVLAIEFFIADGRLFVNEMAPRVHNSGHWTIEGAATSQFENHLRAVCGLPLGDCSPRGHSLMLNLVGHEPDAAAWLAEPGAHLHLYGKEARPGRKVGHVTFVSQHPWTPAELARLEARLR